VHFQLLSTSASGMNLVEPFFLELTQRQLKRLAVSSVIALEDAIHSYIEARNQDPTPFVWTASVEHIIDKVDHGHRTLETIH